MPKYKPGEKTETVEILRAETVGGVHYTGQDSVIPADHARQLVEKKAAVIVTPKATEHDIDEKAAKIVSAAEKLNA